MALRSLDEIYEKSLEVMGDKDSFMNAGDLVAWLPWDMASKIVGRDLKPDSWNSVDLSHRNATLFLKSCIKSAWTHANSQDSRMLTRSLQLISSLLWLLENPTYNIVSSMDYFAKPQLRSLSEEYEVEWVNLDNGCWRYCEGNPCEPPIL